MKNVKKISLQIREKVVYSQALQNKNFSYNF